MIPKGGRPRSGGGPLPSWTVWGKEKLHILLASGFTEGSVGIPQWLRCAPPCIRRTSNSPPYCREAHSVKSREGAEIQRPSPCDGANERAPEWKSSRTAKAKAKWESKLSQHQRSWEEQGQSLETWETKRGTVRSGVGNSLEEAGTEHPRLILWLS